MLFFTLFSYAEELSAGNQTSQPNAGNEESDSTKSKHTQAASNFVDFARSLNARTSLVAQSFMRHSVRSWGAHWSASSLLSPILQASAHIQGRGQSSASRHGNRLDSTSWWWESSSDAPLLLASAAASARVLDPGIQACLSVSDYSINSAVKRLKKKKKKKTRLSKTLQLLHKLHYFSGVELVELYLFSQQSQEKRLSEAIPNRSRGERDCEWNEKGREK